MKPMRAAALLAAGMLAAPALAQAPPQGPPGYAPDEPLWELRVGASGLYGPVYPGASENKLNGVGAPLFIYRGERIRFGEYGVARAIAAETRRFQLDVSLDAAYAAEDAEARAGMPDIDYLFQIGPQAVYRLMDTGWTADGRTEVTAFLPVRGVAATDFSSIDHAGWLAEPAIAFRRQYAGERRHSWTARLFASFADEDLQAYWYEVAPAFAIAGRPAYDAEGGYLSTGVNLSWTRELTEDFQIFLTYQGRYFGGSANADSPLLEEDWTNAVSVSFVWTALQSRRPARNQDM
jgi:MipA family protein